VILADTKFEFGLDPRPGDLVLGDEVLTPDSSRFWPADDYAPGRGQKSFDKQFVRDWASGTGWDKQPPAPEIPRTSSTARARSTSRPTSCSPASRSTPGCRGRASVPRVRVLVRPKEGILDPQGQVVEQALPALGFEGVANVHVGRLIELDVDDPSQVPAMCERLLVNPLIEDFEVQTS
jgi:phosphoribosylformylglycinamidine synthase PurS subunit